LEGTLKRASLLPALLVLVSLAPAPSPAAPAKGAASTKDKQPDAVLAMIAGPVTVHRDGERVTAAFGAQLQTGDVVETGPGAQAGVLFNSGQIIEVGPGSRISIGSLPSKSSAGGKGGEDTVGRVPDALTGQLSRFTQASTGDPGLSALPVLRGAGGEQKLDAIGPRRTLVQPGQVTFAWTPVPEALEYRLTLAGPGTANGSHRATETRFALPADQVVRAGERWTWSVEAMTPEGPVRSETYAFEVASDSLLAGLVSLHERMQPLLESGNESRLDLAHYLLGSYCRSLGFYGDAAAQLETLVARHPERSELHRELGFVYQAIGRYDKAAEEYRLALKD
jgi:hypothetical protein